MGLLDLDRILGVPRPGTLIYCCGPEPLLAAVEQRSAHWPAKSLRVERFKPKPVTGPLSRTEFEVVLARSGMTLTVPADRSILEMLEDAGVDPPYSCTEGTCGTCETRVLDGTPDHRDCFLTAEEHEQGNTMMICVSRSLTPRLVLDR
jgi:ferredoxin